MKSKLNLVINTIIKRIKNLKIINVVDIVIITIFLTLISTPAINLLVNSPKQFIYNQKAKIIVAAAKDAVASNKIKIVNDREYISIEKLLDIKVLKKSPFDPYTFKAFKLDEKVEIINNVDKNYVYNFLGDENCNSNNKKCLVEELSKSQQIVEGVFKGKSEKLDNYVWFSGQLYRVIKIDDTGIKMVTENAVTSIPFSDYSNNYEKSYVRKWLNDIDGKAYSESDLNKSLDGVFYNSISRKDLLVTTKWNIGNINQETLSSYEDKVGLLSIDDYDNSKTKNNKSSYLNNIYYSWTLNGMENSTDKVCFPSCYDLIKTGDTGLVNQAYGVRPVIYLNNNVSIEKGMGSYEEPYIIAGDIVARNGDYLNTRIQGEYVSFDNDIWRIVSKDQLGATRLVLNENKEIKPFYYDRSSLDKSVSQCYFKSIEDNNSEQCNSFFNVSQGNRPLLIDNTYNYNRTNIGYYLNDTKDKNSFYNILNNKKWLVDSKWYLGNYNLGYDYTIMIDPNKTIIAKIGLLRVGEMFASNERFMPYFLITPWDLKSVATITDTGKIEKRYSYDRLFIRPVINLNSNIQIIDGDGRTPNTAYKLALLKK